MQIEILIIATIAVIEFSIGFYVLMHGERDKGSRSFAATSTVTGCWVLSNALVLLEPADIWLRSSYAVAVFLAPISTLWILRFTRRNVTKRQYLALLVPPILLSILTLSTNLIIQNVDSTYLGGFNGSFGPLYILFSFCSLAYVVYMLSILFVETRRTSGERKTQLMFILFGLFLFSIIASFVSFILPLFGIVKYIPIDSLSSIFFVGFSAYTILRHHLYNVKILASELFALVLWMLLGGRLLLANTFRDALIDGFLLLATVFFGILLIRSVKQEVHIREKGERLARYLANANARLRELDKQKTEFVSIASHQLRAPIAAIKGYSSMVLEGSFGKVPQHLEEPLTRVMESGKRIAIMVDDFLNVSRMEQGRMSYAMLPIDLNGLVATVGNELKVIAEGKKLKLKVKLNKAPIMVMGDEGKLKQVCSNIIDNAIKYTPKGQVKATVSLLDTHHAALLKIEDTGIGIPPEELPLLFHKFTRASNANDATVYGTGLGLYIAKEIIRAHNGWIHATSSGKGKGTIFTIELPLAPENTTEKKGKGDS